MSHRIGSWGYVNQQKSSPLFNRIPPELRNLIFDFALAEFTAPALDRPINHDFSVRDDHEKLQDEPDMESGPATQPGDQGEHENGIAALEVENGPAPAVQALPASFLFRPHEMKHSWDWFRPGYIGQRKMHTASLGTCRRVYLETCVLPSQGSKIFYNARGPRWCPRSPNEYFSGLASGAARHIRNLQIFSQMWFLEKDLMDLVTGVFTANTYFITPPPLNLWTLTNPPWRPPMAFPPLLTPQLYQDNYLPDGPLPSHVSPPGSAGPSLWQDLLHAAPIYLSESARIRPWRVTENLTSLRIYLRRTDWWNWESNAPLVINPFSPSTPTRQQMHDSMRASVEADRLLEPRLRSSSPSAIPRWACWGLLFLRMPSLQKLTIDFETAENKKDEMETIVDWAHSRWRFPVLRRLSGDERDPYTYTHLRRSRNDSPADLSPWSQDMDVLYAADEPVEKTSWRGLPHHFAMSCHACGVWWRNEDVTPDCTECTKRDKLLALNKGPQLLVWTVNWKRKVPPTDPEPEANAGEAGSQERGGQLRPGTAPAERQDGPGPSSAEFRTRRRRELEELRRKVTF